MEDNNSIKFFNELLNDDIEKKILKLIMVDGLDPDKDAEKILDILLSEDESK